MAHGLSTLARLLKRGAFEEFETGVDGPRSSPYMPARRGFTRGTLGATGSTFGPATRNPDAQIDEERELLQSPIMHAFLEKAR